MNPRSLHQRILPIFTLKLQLLLIVLAHLETRAADLLLYLDFNDVGRPGIVPDVAETGLGTASLVPPASITDEGFGFSQGGEDRALDLGEVGDGAAASISPGKLLLLANLNDSIAVSFWQRIREIGNTSSFWILAPSAGPNQRGMQAHVPWSNGAIYFDHSGYLTSAERLTDNANLQNTKVSADTWQHFVFQKSRDGRKQVWIDGALYLDQANGAAPLMPLNGAVMIGAEGTARLNSIGGLIDDFAIYDDVLLPQQIAALASGNQLPSDIASAPADSDQDGMPDRWEDHYGLDSSDSSDAQGDLDGDGLDNFGEYGLCSDPTNPDSDNDGLSDGDELLNASDPNKPDSDGDGMNDGYEVTHGLDPNDATNDHGYTGDPDEDGLANGVEAREGTHPNNPDTDADGFSDSEELTVGSDPIDASKLPNPFALHTAGYWPMDVSSENPFMVPDVSGNAIHGTWHGSTSQPSIAPGKFGDAIAFDPTRGDHVVLDGTPSATGTQADVKALNSVNGSLSISCWASVSGLRSAWPTLVAKGDGWSTWRLARWAGHHKLYYNGGTLQPDTGNLELPLDDGKLHHIVAVTREQGSSYLPAGCFLYLDGELVAQSLGDPHLGKNPNEDIFHAVIGHNPDLPESTWNGVIDDVAIWKRPLSPGEIQWLYNGGEGRSVGDALTDKDSDQDGLSNALEERLGTDRNEADAGLDTDGDGLTNYEEFQLGTDPTKPDSDNDGLRDADEWLHATDPTDPDSDDDGLQEGPEVLELETDPLNPDSDGDGLHDGEEVTQHGSDPNAIDTDGDGATDFEEVAAETNPTDGSKGPALFSRGLAGYWPMEPSSENVAMISDASGNGNHGTWRNKNGIRQPGGGHVVQGKFGNAIAFGSSQGDYVELDGAPGLTRGPAADVKALSSVDGSLSISCWASIWQFSTNWQTLVAKGEGSSWRLARRRDESGLSYAGGLADTPSGQMNVYDGQLHHFVAVTREQGTEHLPAGTFLFVDGQLVAQTLGDPSLCTDPSQDNAFATIGANPKERGRNWDGIIDDVAIWKRALSPGEVQWFYQEGDGRSVDDAIDALDSDADGLPDDLEEELGTDKNVADANADTDGDGLSNLKEFQILLDPNNPDSDSDSYSDGEEIDAGTDPKDPTSNPGIIADSIEDWDRYGEGDAEGWSNGYRNFTLDGGGNDYDPDAAFIPFKDDNRWVWVGASWLYDTSDAPPWPVTRVGFQQAHPNGTNNGEIHWAIRRWAANVQQPTPLALIWSVRREHGGCGNGVTGSLHINGEQRDSLTVAFDDTTGEVRTYYATIKPGDLIDVALSPQGTDGLLNDYCDESFTTLRVSRGIPTPAHQPDGTLYVPVSPEDTDADQLLDVWEFRYFPDDLTLLSGTEDFDRDGLTDLQEMEASTNPTKIDSDGDGFSDAEELAAGTNPTDPPLRTDLFNNSLAGYWPMEVEVGNESLVRDHSGNGNHGTFLSLETSEPATSAQGKFGNGIFLDSDYREYVVLDGAPESTGSTTDPEALNSVNGSLSISCWASVSQFTSNWQTLVAKGEGDAWRLARRRGESGLSYAGGIQDTPSSGVPVDDGEIHHIVAVTRDLDDDPNDHLPAGSFLFVDGQLVAQTLGDPSLCMDYFQSDAHAAIGHNPKVSTLNRTWGGMIDDVAVWKRALSPGEVQWLYQDGTGLSVSDALVQEDSDGDGLPDRLEVKLGTMVDSPDSHKDPDGDGLTNLEEFQLTTNPLDNDSDRDGIPDGSDSDPLSPTNNSPYLVWADANALLGTPADDDDGDGLCNVLEYILATDPLAPTDSATRFSASVQTIDSEDYVTLTVTRDPTAEDALVYPEVSTDLANWSSEASDVVLVASEHHDGMVTELFRSTTPWSEVQREFIRIAVALE